MFHGTNGQGINLDEEAGYVTVTCGDASVRLDAFLVNDRIADLHAQHQGKSNAEYAEALQALIVELGLPHVSVFAAGQFVRGIVDACEMLKKSFAPLPEWPASTDSTRGGDP